MALEDENGQERTEDASPERREEFREKGQIPVSREISSVFVLFSSASFLLFYLPSLTETVELIFIQNLQQSKSFRIDLASIIPYCEQLWITVLIAITPIFLVSASIASASTLLQTRFNWSWKRLQPQFSRLNPLKGLVRLVNTQALMELIKGILKMIAVSIVAYLILRSEWNLVPGLLNVPLTSVWSYWADITIQMIWAVCALLILVGGIDYVYNFMSLERQMKMTKQEVKEEYKRREVDPQIKARIRRIARDIATRKMIDATHNATVVITNPTHYAVALKYEVGMPAPLVVAKGIDYIAQRIREAAQEADVPIIENPPLARTLYKIVEVDQEIPASLYAAIAEIIKFVFRKKGISISKNQPQ